MKENISEKDAKLARFESEQREMEAIRRKLANDLNGLEDINGELSREKAAMLNKMTEKEIEADR